MQIQSFESRDAAFDAVAQSTITTLSASVASKGHASILFSGGRTPAPAYRQIASAEIDWSRVSIGLVDDRWVDEPDPASNGYLVRQTVIDAGAGAAKFVPMKTAHGSPFDAEIDLNVAYQPFEAPDVAILGMGPDGHTASWFPGSRGLSEAMSPETPKFVAGIDAKGCPVAGELTDRITVTLPVLVRAKKVILLITGEEKLDVLKASANNLPIHQLFDARDNLIETVWAPA